MSKLLLVHLSNFTFETVAEPSHPQIRKNTTQTANFYKLGLWYSFTIVLMLLENATKEKIISSLFQKWPLLIF